MQDIKLTILKLLAEAAVKDQNQDNYFEEMKNTLIRNCICSHTNCFKSILVTWLSSFHENIDITARLDMDMDMGYG